MIFASRPAHLLAATLVAAFVLPVSAQTSSGPRDPNELEGHLTNAFLPGFPEEIDALARSLIQSSPLKAGSRQLMAAWTTIATSRSSCIPWMSAG